MTTKTPAGLGDASVRDRVGGPAPEQTEHTVGDDTPVPPNHDFDDTQINLREHSTPPHYPAVDCPLGCGYWHAGETLEAGWQIMARHISVEHHADGAEQLPPQVRARNAMLNANSNTRDWLRTLQDLPPSIARSQAIRQVDTAIYHIQASTDAMHKAMAAAAEAGNTT